VIFPDESCKHTLEEKFVKAYHEGYFYSNSFYLMLSIVKILLLEKRAKRRCVFFSFGGEKATLLQ
jgi:hypothetical protein